MKFSHAIRGAGSFIRTLVSPRDVVRETSPEGYDLLQGWDSLPEGGLEQRLKDDLKREGGSPAAVLFCYSGPLAGESLALGRSPQRIGVSAECDHVLTPIQGLKQTAFRTRPGRTLSLMVEKGGSFRLNGAEETEAVLLDYDELELLGNRFVVLLGEGGSL